MVIAAGFITANAIMKPRLLGDALSHHSNPCCKPGYSKEMEMGKEKEKESEHDSE